MKNLYQVGGELVVVDGTIENSFGEEVKKIKDAYDVAKAIYCKKQLADKRTNVWSAEDIRLLVDLCEKAGFRMPAYTPESFGITYEDYLNSDEEFDAVLSKACYNYESWLNNNKKTSVYFFPSSRDGGFPKLTYNCFVDFIETGVIGVCDSQLKYKVAEKECAIKINNAEELLTKVVGNKVPETVDDTLSLAKSLNCCLDVCINVGWVFPHKNNPGEWGVSTSLFNAAKKQHVCFGRFCYTDSFDKWVKQIAAIDANLVGQLRMVISMLETLNKSDKEINEIVEEFVDKIRGHLSDRDWR